MTALLPSPDICSHRHLGNPESIAAHSRVRPSLLTDRARVLDAIRQSGSHGLTSKEYANQSGKQLNEISGRFSELKAYKLIVKSGVRNGCGVYRISEVPRQPADSHHVAI